MSSALEYAVRVSPSQIKMMIERPGAYFMRYIEEEKRGENPHFFVSGTILHKALELIGTQYKGSIERCSKEEARRVLAEVISTRGDYPSEQIVNDATTALMAMVEDVNWENVAHIEHPWDIDMGFGYGVSGIMDLVEIKDGFIRITDWKKAGNVMSKAEMSRDIQVALYLAAARRIWPEHTIVARWWYCEPNINVSVEWTEEIDDYAMTMAQAACFRKETVTGERWACRFQSSCSWCAYSGDCPEYAEAMEAGVEDKNIEEISLDSLSERRQFFKSLEAVAKNKAAEIDSQLRNHLEDDKLTAGGFDIKLAGRRNVSYPSIESTLNVFTEIEGIPASEIFNEVCKIDGTKLKKWMAARGFSKRKDIQSALEAVASIGVSQYLKFTKAKEIKND